MSALLLQARNGDAGASEQLLGNLQRYLGFVAQHQFDRKLQAKMGPSDIVQQSMIRAVENLEQFRGETLDELRGWLRQILVNEARQMKRDLHAQKRDVAHELPMTGSQTANPVVDHMPTPGTDAVQSEQRAEIHRALAQLSERERSIIQWRNWDGLTFSEIANRLGVSENTASRKWLKALTAFKEQLKDDVTRHG